MRSRYAAQRGAVWCEGSAPARNDTTSEPTVGNNRPGAPVTESGKGQANQQQLRPKYR